MTLDSFSIFAQRLRNLLNEQNVGNFVWEDNKLRLSIAGNELHISLDNFYQDYAVSGHSYEHIVERIRRALSGALASPLADQPLAAIQAMLLPKLELHAHLDQTLGEDTRRVFVPWQGALVIALTIDQGATIGFVTNKHLAEWNLTVDDLLPIAMDNLAQRMQAPSIRNLETGYLIEVWRTDDGYDASRVLVTDYWRALNQQYPNLTLWLPHRDLLVASNHPTTEMLFEHIWQQEQTHRYRLLPEAFFQVRGDRVLMMVQGQG